MVAGKCRFSAADCAVWFSDPMNLPSSPTACPDCARFSRREFLKTTIAASAAVGGIPIIGRAATAAASETLVATLFKSLRDDQRKELCFSFDHPLRVEVDNNWHITDKPI